MSYVAKGEKEYAFQVPFPVVLDRGVFKEGTAYEHGDAVTFGGSLWIAQRIRMSGKSVAGIQSSTPQMCGVLSPIISPPICLRVHECAPSHPTTFLARITSRAPALRAELLINGASSGESALRKTPLGIDLPSCEGVASSSDSFRIVTESG